MNFNSGKSKNVKSEIQNRMNSQEERRRWHQKASNCPLDYTAIEQLKTLMISKSEVLFPNSLGIPQDEFSVMMKDLTSIRNVLCHMNPLDSTSIKDLSVKFDRWEKLVKQYSS